jgi:hypothetical protein
MAMLAPRLMVATKMQVMADAAAAVVRTLEILKEAMEMLLVKKSAEQKRRAGPDSGNWVSHVGFFPA